MKISSTELDRLQSDYKSAGSAWISAILHEEDLASVDHSVAELDKWEEASFQEEDARTKAKEAKRHYEDALREGLFHF